MSIVFKDLKGMVFKSVVGKVGDGEIFFTTQKGRKFRLYHDQDCCEDVRVDDICGELNDLTDAKILMAFEDTHEGEGRYGDSSTWTFYNIATSKGHVTIKWLGSSNGYYSERVDFEEVK